MSGQAKDFSQQIGQAAPSPSGRFVSELERMGWTNQTAAQVLGVSERQVTRWRSGQEPRLASVQQWAQAFGRPVAWFYTEPDEVAA